MAPKVKKHIWYQVKGRDINHVNKPSINEFVQLREEIKTKESLQASASALILIVKKVDEHDYTILNANFFCSKCSNNFNRLVARFNITEDNPIKVTLLCMSLFAFNLLLI